MTTAEKVVIVGGAMALLYGQFAGYSWVKRPEPDSRAWQIQDFRKDWRACCQFARKPDVQIQEPPDEALGAGVPRKGDPGSITQSSSALLLVEEVANGGDGRDRLLFHQPVSRVRDHDRRHIRRNDARDVGHRGTE